MNTPRSIARFASCAPLRSLLGNTPLVRSQSLRHFSKASDKAAGAAQNYQNGLSLKPLGPKGYSQGPKDGKQGQETLNQLQDKPAGTAHNESTKSPDNANQKDQHHNHEHVQKRESSFVQEENEGKGMQEENKKEEEEPAPPKDQTYQSFVKLLNFMKIYPPLAWDFLVRRYTFSKEKFGPVYAWLAKKYKNMKPFTNRERILSFATIAIMLYEIYSSNKQGDKQVAKLQQVSHNTKAPIEREQAKKKAIIDDFQSYCHQAAQKKAKRADLVIKEDQSNQVRVLSFIGNEQWNLKAHFSWLANKDRFSIEDQKVLYIHGDPGIGKSTAFTSLVHNMNNGTSKVKADLKAGFPFLTDFKHFIYINVSDYNFKNKSDHNLTVIVESIKASEEALVVFDDAHTIFKKGEEKALEFYKDLNKKKATGVKCIVLLSSQGPRPEHNQFKDRDIMQRCLYELDKIEAIVQLQYTIRLNKQIDPTIPLSLSRLIAHRLWFYLGGNFRAVNRLFEKASVSIDNLCNKASDMVRAEQEKAQTQSDRKSLSFPQTLDSLKQYHEKLFIQELTNLEYGFKYSQPQDSDLGAKIQGLVDKNILIIKDKEVGKETISMMSFHSRRVHYAFNRWLAFHYLKEYAQSQDIKDPLNFLKLLESTECRYILSFPLLPFHEILEMKRVNELEIMKKIPPTKKSEEQKKGESIHYLGVEVNPVVAKSVVELMEAQLNLVMYLFEATQEGRKLDSFHSDNHQLTPIIDDLKKGHAYFLDNQDAEFKSKMNQEDRNTKMTVYLNEIREKSTAEVLKVKNQILGALYGQCVRDFMELGQFEKKGVSITVEDLKNCARGKKEKGKYNDIKEQIEKIYGQDLMNKTRKEMLVMGLDLIVDLNYHMKFWDQEAKAEGAQEEKADEAAKQGP